MVDSTFITASGITIDLLNPRVQDININDITSGLSKICRFGGQISHFYSVAQHSVLCSHLAPQELKKAALMHDASEAYLGDVIKPLKNLLGAAYEEIEARFMERIFERFGVSILMLPKVKEFDKELYRRESDAFRYGRMNDWKEFTKTHKVWPNVWDCKQSEALFFTRYVQLFDKEVFI